MSNQARVVENVLTDGSISYDVHIEAENNDNALILLCDDEKTANKITAFIDDLYADGCIVGIETKY